MQTDYFLLPTSEVPFAAMSGAMIDFKSLSQNSEQMQLPRYFKMCSNSAKYNEGRKVRSPNLAHAFPLFIGSRGWVIQYNRRVKGLGAHLLFRLERGKEGN